MKKRLFPLIAVIIMAIAAISSVSSQDIVDENESALDDGGSSSEWPCWSSIKNRAGSTWKCGNPCKEEVGLPNSGKSTCKAK